MLRTVSMATPTKMMTVVPPRARFRPVIMPKMIGRIATRPRKIAPMKVIRLMILPINSAVGRPGRMPGMVPLLLRMLLDISIGLYCVLT